MYNLKELFYKAINCSERIAGNKTQYKITTDDDNVYLAIEGSVDKQDWIYNFMFMPAPYKNKKYKWFVHKGFGTAWKLARDQIAKEVESVASGKKLVILGYSHGAALATLAHEYFQFSGYKPSTYVFGSPRVLWFPSKTIRSRFLDLTMVNRCGDLVAHVPPTVFGYKHIAIPELIGTKKSIWWTRHLVPEYMEALK